MNESPRNSNERRRLPMMEQTWEDLLFLHWRTPVAALRPLVPPELEIEEFDGSAWVGITPLTIRGMRLPYLPAIPMLSDTLEVNVRTYVRREGVSGIWFLSLEASNRAAVLAARIGFGLPYRSAKMAKRTEGEAVEMDSHRLGEPRSAELSVRWSREERLPDARPGTLEYFLIERYCLYTTHVGGLWRIRIRHRPWPLCCASLASFSESLLAVHGVQVQGGPLVHAQTDPLRVEAYLPERT